MALLMEPSLRVRADPRVIKWTKTLRISSISSEDPDSKTKATASTLV